jgi:hypothetical protein
VGWINWPNPPSPGSPPGPPGFSPHDYWRDPVIAFANLPATGNETGDVRQVLTGPEARRAYTWDGAAWQPFPSNLASTFWLDPVANFAALPLVGNAIGDVRQTLDTKQLFTWTAASPPWEPISTTTTGGQTFTIVPYGPAVPVWPKAPNAPAVYIDVAGVAQLAVAIGVGATQAQGFAFDFDVDGPGLCKMISDGPLGGFVAPPPLVPGTSYALSDVMPGDIVAPPAVPAIPGTFAQWLGTAETPADLMIDVDSTIIVN